jgi:hypothetical protein
VLVISKGNEDTQRQNENRGEDNEGVVGDEDPDLASTHHDQRAGNANSYFERYSFGVN